MISFDPIIPNNHLSRGRRSTVGKVCRQPLAVVGTGWGSNLPGARRMVKAGPFLAMATSRKDEAEGKRSRGATLKSGNKSSSRLWAAFRNKLIISPRISKWKLLLHTLFNSSLASHLCLWHPCLTPWIKESFQWPPSMRDLLQAQWIILEPHLSSSTSPVSQPPSRPCVTLEHCRCRITHLCPTINPKWSHRTHVWRSTANLPLSTSTSRSRANCLNSTTPGKRSAISLQILMFRSPGSLTPPWSSSSNSTTASPSSHRLVRQFSPTLLHLITSTLNHSSTRGSCRSCTLII